MPMCPLLTDIMIRIVICSLGAWDADFVVNIKERPIMGTKTNIIIIDAFLEIGIVDQILATLFALF